MLIKKCSHFRNQARNCERKWILCTCRDRFSPQGNFISSSGLLPYCIHVFQPKWQITHFLYGIEATFFYGASLLRWQKMHEVVFSIENTLTSWHVSSVTYWISDAQWNRVEQKYVMGTMNDIDIVGKNVFETVQWFWYSMNEQFSFDFRGERKIV